MGLKRDSRIGELRIDVQANYKGGIPVSYDVELGLGPATSGKHSSANAEAALDAAFDTISKLYEAVQ